MLPEQTGEEPVIAPGVPGAETGAINLHWNELQPQPLQARTQTFPAPLPTVTLIDVVPCPELIDQPEGTVHW